MAERINERPFTSRRIIGIYVITVALFTLSTSLIWSINTLFLLEAGLALPMVFVVNAWFTASQMLCQVPTGVVADMLGRKTSFLLAVAILIVSTLIYVLSSQLHWGVLGFIIGSVLIGLGFTFQIGSVDAWMVDALSACALEQPKEEVLSRVFALSGAVSGAVLVVGPLLGGLLGQVSLALPYYLRIAALGLTFIVVAVTMREIGFEKRPLTFESFVRDTRSLAVSGFRTGWGNPVIRPLLWVAFAQGIFFVYGFYSLSPYLLQLIGRNYVWLTGAVFSVYAFAGILGNLSVRWGILRRRDGSTRSAPDVLAALGVAAAVLITLIGVAGLVGPKLMDAGLGLFSIVAGLWVIGGFISGAALPISSAYLNEQIASNQRATVLSINAVFNDGGGVLGQPALGYTAQALGIAATWLIGGIGMFAVAPLYRASRRAGIRQSETPIEHSE